MILYAKLDSRGCCLFIAAIYTNTIWKMRKDNKYMGSSPRV
jgi:hypothetical protein